MTSDSCLVDKRKQDTIKNIEKESIIPLYALTKKETYYNEQIFQSLNKFLMDLKHMGSFIF